MTTKALKAAKAFKRRHILPLIALAALSALSAAGVQAQAPLTPATPAAPPPEVAAELGGARLQGSGTLRFVGLRVYDARLWAGAAVAGVDWATAPLALEFEYARSLDGVRIAERSLTEMRRQSDIDADVAERWLGAMKQLFPDVKAGDRITGINVPGMGARFFINGRLKGDVRDLNFARHFFGIWLSPKTSEPALRDSLLGKVS